MISEIFPYAFVAMMVMVAIWFALVMWVFSRLRTHHLSLYEEIGSPSLFWNNSMRNNWLFLKFMWSLPPKDLNDPLLWNTVRFMRIFLVCYIALFAALFVTILSGKALPIPPPPNIPATH